MKSVDLFIAFDHFVTFFPTSERRLLPVASPFDTYDEMTFRECYRLSILWRTARTRVWASASLHNLLRSAVRVLQAAAFAGRSLVCAVVT